MVGKIVEVHLLNGKRFIGKVKHKDSDGILLYCVPVRVLETAQEGGDLRGQLRDILHTLFFPYVNIEYVDVGGEPVGFDKLFANWFGGEPLDSFFDFAELDN